MNIIFIILGVFFIFAMVGIGEKIINKNHFNKNILLIILLMEIICLFIGEFTIKNISISIATIVIPIALSLVFLFEIKNIKYLKNIIINYLFVVLFMQLFLIFNLYNYFNFEYLPTVFFAIFFAIVGRVICRYPKQAFSSICLGVLSGEFLYNYTLSSLLQTFPLSLGSEQTLLLLLVTFASVLYYDYFLYYSRKRKIFMSMKKCKKQNV